MKKKITENPTVEDDKEADALPDELATSPAPALPALSGEALALQNLCGAVQKISKEVRDICEHIRATNELIPAEHTEAVLEAAGNLRAAKGVLLKKRRDLAAAEADCLRLARQNADDDELRSANASVATLMADTHIAGQRYHAAVENQRSAASAASAAGIRPTPKRWQRLHDVLRQTTGKRYTGEPPTLALGTCAADLAGWIENCTSACIAELQDDPNRGRTDLARQTVREMCEPLLRAAEAPSVSLVAVA